MGALFGVIINFAIYYFIFRLIIKSLPKREAEPIVFKGPKKWKKKEEGFLSSLAKEEVLPPQEKKKAESGLVFPELASEKRDEIYYNETESSYNFSKNQLKEAIVYSEIIGQPVSRKRFGFNRR